MRFQVDINSRRKHTIWAGCSPSLSIADAEAAAMVAAFQATVAANLGVAPSAIVITGVHTDGDAAPGETDLEG